MYMYMTRTRMCICMYINVYLHLYDLQLIINDTFGNHPFRALRYTSNSSGFFFLQRKFQLFSERKVENALYIFWLSIAEN